MGDVAAVLSRLPGRAAERVQAAGLPLAAVEPVLSWPDADGILFSGSVATGVGQPESDLDFVVLHEEPGDFAGLIAGRGFDPVEVTASSLVDRLLRVVPGTSGEIEFDVWVVSRAQAEELRRVMVASVGEDGSLLSAPGLAYLEMKLLIRLHEGTVLQAPGTVAAWRSELRVSALPAIRIAGGLVGCLSFLEDAWSIGRLDEGSGAGDDFGAVIATRSAAEHLMQAALAASGTLNWDLRYARLHRDRLAAEGATCPAVLDRLETLLLPVRGVDPRAYAQEVLDACTGLIRTDLPRRAEGLTALRYIREFAAGRFALDLSVLDEPA